MLVITRHKGCAPPVGNRRAVTFTPFTANLFVGNNGNSNRLVVADSGRVVANLAIYAQYNAGVLVTGTGTLASSYVYN